MEDMQTKLIERVRKHLEWVDAMAIGLKMGFVVVLIMGGYMLFLRTNGSFGDVPMLAGVYYLKKLFTDL